MNTIKSKMLGLHPATLVLASFISAIIIGTVLLKLPFATKTQHISLIDTLFTATSAVCVTGLVVVDTGKYFTVFGQLVILALIQIGGLGIMTLSVAFFRWIGHTISFQQRMVIKELFLNNPGENIFDLVKTIMLVTLSVEVAGVVLLTVHWSREFSFDHAVYLAVFHSVSAFCNAGFVLFSNNMISYSGSLMLNITLLSLIVVGGIGFPVIYEILNLIIKRKKTNNHLSLQTKMVVLTTIVLIITGALIYAYTEYNNLGANQSLSYRILVPLFQAITCRTAGFNTVDISSLHDSTLALMILLMFIGASPGSCGGGVKTTTIFIILAFTLSRIKKHKRVTLFKKSVPDETVTRSISLILVSIGIICFVFYMLIMGNAARVEEISGQQGLFLPYLFETVSAFGTVGLSMGVTTVLNSWGKVWIILMMLIGRVGVISFAYVVVGTDTTNDVEYSEENIMVG